MEIAVQKVVNGNLCSNDKFHISNTPPSIFSVMKGEYVSNPGE